MSDDQHRAGDPPAVPSPCSLRQACVKAGLDGGGRRCVGCPLWGLCQSDVRWLIKTAHEEWYRC